MKKKKEKAEKSKTEPRSIGLTDFHFTRCDCEEMKTATRSDWFVNSNTIYHATPE